MLLNFFGACREVTGSNILVETHNKRILLECGVFQGFREAEERNYSPFPYDPKSLDFVIVCHAHLDHTGRLPKLTREGFGGTIFATGPTKELTQLVLEDSEKLMSEEARKDKHQPLFEREDISRTLELFETIHWGEKVEISPGISIIFRNAGHILGSCILELEADGKKLVYTSDLGNTPSLLLDPPDIVNSADIVICESTYGGRVHEDPAKRMQKLTEIINKTIAQNGVLMIPSFAIERTQELLHDIDHFCSVEGCEKPQFYLDSPLASKVTGVFSKYIEYLAKNIRSTHRDNNFFGLDRLKITASVDESKAIDFAPNPKVIIAGSGMMNGGRILYHLQKYLPDENNTLLIVGYQAKGTIGRRIFNGDKQVRIFGHEVDVRANIEAIGSYSAHADMPQLVFWLTKIEGVKKVFLVHGESEQAIALSGAIRAQMNAEVLIPQLGEKYEI